MDVFVNLVQAGAALETAVHLKELDAAQGGLPALMGQFHLAYSALTLPLHTAGILHLLCAEGDDLSRCSSPADLPPPPPTATDSLVTGSARCASFFGTADVVILRLLLPKVSSLVEAYGIYHTAQQTASRGISPLATAIQRVRLSPNHLTCIHDVYLKLCLKAKRYGAARRFVADDIFSIMTERRAGQVGMSVQRALQYYYYGALVFIGLAEFERALEFLTVAIATPADVTSQVVVEAYQKYSLVSLIVHGKLKTLPKYTPAQLTRVFQTNCIPYKKLCTAYETHRVKDLDLAIQEYLDVLNEHKNFGLVKQCRETLFRQNIRRLTETFITLSLEDIARRVSLESAAQAEHYLLRMIANHEIFATINSVTGMVSFHDDPEQFDTAATMTALEDLCAASATLHERMGEMDRELRVNPKLLKPKARAAGSMAMHDELLDLDGASYHVNM